MTFFWLVLIIFCIIMIPIAGIYLFGRIMGAGVRDSWADKNRRENNRD